MKSISTDLSISVPLKEVLHRYASLRGNYTIDIFTKYIFLFVHQ